MSSSDRMLVVLGIALAACSGGYSTHAGKPARGSAAIDAGRMHAMDESRVDAMDARVAGSNDADTSPVDTPDAGAQSPASGSRPTRLVLDFTTVTLSGKYAPHNGGTAWVADAQGKWVHTFEIWIGPYYSALKAYFAAGGPNYVTYIAGVTGMMVPPDVITGATLNTHKTHPTETWNLLDANGNEVPDGDYSIVIEVVEQNPELVYTMPFTKADEPAQWQPPDTGNLKNVSLRLE